MLKFVLLVLTGIFLTGPVSAEELVRSPGFTTTNPGVISPEEYRAQQLELQRNGTSTSWFKTTPQNSRNQNDPVARQNLNRTFGTANVNAAHTLWSNLNR